jgi:DNA-binding CsgD family transcriptional regulator
MKRGSRTGNADQWDALMGDIYEIVLEPNRIQDVLAQCDRWLGSQLSHLMGWDSRIGAPTISVMSNPSFDHAGQAYAQYYGQIDPRRYHAQGASPGSIWACHDHFDSTFVSKSEFYQDFLIPNGARYVLGGFVHEADSLRVYIVFNHLVGQDEFNNDQRDGMRRLMPHLQRALRLTLSANALRSGMQAGEQGLSALGQAVFTLDGIGRIAFLNTSAESLLRQGTVLQATAQRLMGKGADAMRLAGALDRVRLSRQAESLILCNSRDLADACLVSILPVPRADMSAASRRTDAFGGPGQDMGAGASWISNDPDLVVLAVPQRRTRGAAPRRLIELFQLSEAEAKLAHGLSSGLSVEEFAAAHAISVATARTQLRSILAKTGERRQHDLVRMLALLPTQG